MTDNVFEKLNEQTGILGNNRSSSVGAMLFEKYMNEYLMENPYNFELTHVITDTIKNNPPENVNNQRIEEQHISQYMPQLIKRWDYLFEELAENTISRMQSYNPVVYIDATDGILPIDGNFISDRSILLEPETTVDLNMGLKISIPNEFILQMKLAPDISKHITLINPTFDSSDTHLIFRLYNKSSTQRLSITNGSIIASGKLLRHHDMQIEQMILGGTHEE